MARLTRRDGSPAIPELGNVAYMYPQDVGKLVVHGAQRELFPDVVSIYEDEPVNSLKVLMATDDLIMFEAFRAKGSVDVAHVHADHYAIVYLKQGRVRMRIGHETFVMEAGDTCYHPRGMLHQHEALEDCIRVETKVYPAGGAVAGWNRLMGIET